MPADVTGAGTGMATRRSGSTPQTATAAKIIAAASRGNAWVSCNIDSLRFKLMNEGEALATPPRGRGATPSCSNKRP